MKKILLVDDDSVSNELILIYLEEERTKFEFHFADNGEDAVRSFRENAIDLIIMDHRMPVMDGIQALKIIRGIDKDVPIIMSSGVCGACKMECMDFGANGILPKPFTVGTVKEAISKALGE